MLNDLLSLKHFNRIKFHDKTHTYFVDGKVVPISVTKLIEHHKPSFNSDYFAGKKAKELGCSKEDILHIWKGSNFYSTQLGSYFHSYVENYFQNKIKPFPFDYPQISKLLDEGQKTDLVKNCKDNVAKFDRFIAEHGHLLPIRSELVVGDLDTGLICGMMDLLVYDEKIEGYAIYDYKTNKRFSYSSRFNKKFCKPLSDIECCEFNDYSIQLSLYKIFIERYTSLKIKEMNILWFHNSNEECQLIKCADMTEAALRMLDNVPKIVADLASNTELEK